MKESIKMGCVFIVITEKMSIKSFCLAVPKKTKQSKDISEAERIAQLLPKEIRILETDEDLTDYLDECKKQKENE